MSKMAVVVLENDDVAYVYLVPAEEVDAAKMRPYEGE
jgi:hypothetical protein